MGNTNNSANSSQAHDGRDNSTPPMDNATVNPNNVNPNSSMPPVNPNNVPCGNPDGNTLQEDNNMVNPDENRSCGGTVDPKSLYYDTAPKSINAKVDKDGTVNLGNMYRGELLDCDDDFMTAFNGILPDNEVKLYSLLNPTIGIHPYADSNSSGVHEDLISNYISSQAYDNVIGSSSYHNQVHNESFNPTSTWPQTMHNGVAYRMQNDSNSSQRYDGGSSFGAHEESTIPDNSSFQANNNVIGSRSYWNQMHNDSFNLFSSSSRMMRNGLANRSGGNSSQLYDGGSSSGAHEELMIPSSQAYHDQNMIGSSSYWNQVNNDQLNLFSNSSRIMYNNVANRNCGNFSQSYNDQNMIGSSSCWNQVNNDPLNLFSGSSQMMYNDVANRNGGISSQAYHDQNMIGSSNYRNQVNNDLLSPINTSIQMMENGMANCNGGNSSGLYNGNSSSGAHKDLMNPSFQAYHSENMITSSSNSNQMHNGGLDPAEVQRVFDRLPIGYRFRPTDLDLVVSYLMKKVHGQPLPADIIPSFYVYSMSPSKLTRRFNPLAKSEWFFFSQRRKKYPNGTRPDRSTPGGYWKPTGIDQDIPPQPQSRLGIKRTLDFYQGKPKEGQRTEWKMHEYVLKNDGDNGECSHNAATKPNDKMLLDECVLYRIYKSNRKGGGKSDGGTSDDDVDPNIFTEGSCCVNDNENSDDN